MNEVRVVCAHMLDGPEPPLRDADEILRIARNSKRRRGYLTAVTLGGTVAAALVGVVVVGSALTGARPPATSENPDSVPAARAPSLHGRTMARVMLSAVPSGYAATPETTFSDAGGVYPVAPQAGERPQILAGAVVRVFKGPREGQLFAYLVHDGQPQPTGDLCASTVSPAPRSGATCETRTIAGVSVRVETYSDPQYGQVIEATRFIRDGRLIVGADQGVARDLQRFLGAEVYQPKQSLPGPPVDADGIAALGADPAMVPAS